MRVRLLVVAVAGFGILTAADKKPITGQTANESLAMQATAYLDKESVKQIIGAELDTGIVVVEVRLKPEPDHKLVINRDDFLLRSDKDGQRSQPFAPSQIAGSSVLMVSTRAGGGGRIMGDSQGPVWGGIGGPPRRMGGDGGGIGNSSESSAQATVAAGNKDKKDNPLLEVLSAKILPEKEVAGPISGLLYFLIEGKHKPKDLELVYKGAGGNLSLRFRQ